jgi:hypothetical protein
VHQGGSSSQIFRIALDLCISNRIKIVEFHADFFTELPLVVVSNLTFF